MTTRYWKKCGAKISKWSVSVSGRLPRRKMTGRSRRGGRSVTARFSDREATVEKFYRNLDATSLEVRAYIDFDGLLETIAKDPRSIAIALVAEHAKGTTQEGMRARLADLGVSPETVEAWWAHAEIALATDQNVKTTGDPPTRW